MKFEIIPTKIDNLVIIQRKAIRDSRGYFSRFFCSEDLYKAGFLKSIQQINHTFTIKKGAFRGFHFQHYPHSEMKMVSCLRGEILDIAIDIREKSRTFLHWHTEILSENNQKSLLIPEGFAHGFQTLTENCELLYLHTEKYYPEYEGAINYQDPKLGLSLPLEITEISDRDKNHPLLTSEFVGIKI